MPIQPRATSFRVGGPIQDPALFIGRKELLQSISNAMFNLQNVSLHGERRTGKTSLLLYIANNSVKLGLPENFIPVYFNFQEFTEVSLDNVWQAIAEAIAEQMSQSQAGANEESAKVIAASTDLLTSSIGTDFLVTGFGRGLSLLHDIGIKVHLLFDEFDQTVRNPELGDPFYDALRSLPTRAENISYVIASRTGLAALQPTYSKVSSPFFNIFTSMTLTPFTEEEVTDLIFDYFSRADIDLQLAEKLAADTKFLYKTTGYHPFFIQALCYHLSAIIDKPEWPFGQAKQIAVKALAKDSEPHFKFYWDVSSDTEKRMLTSLASKKKVDFKQSSNSAIAERLRDRCLVVPDPESDSKWRIFSSIFGKWINEGIWESPAKKKPRRKHAVVLVAILVTLFATLALGILPSLKRSILSVIGLSSKATISIQTNPNGAVVFVDGDSIGMTPITDYSLESGYRSLRFEKPDFFPFDTSVVINNVDAASLSFEIQPVARVSIRIVPSIVDVILDNERINPARLVGIALATGEHQIRIAANGYQSENHRFGLVQGDNPPITYALEKTGGPPTVGRLRVVSQPSRASLFVDNRLKGITPFEDNTVQPGSYGILIRSDGYEDFSRTAIIRKGETSLISAQLTELAGRISITSQPAGAAVYLDGQEIGATPLQDKKIKIGDHTILLRSDGYRDYSTQVKVDAGKPSRIDQQLVPLIGDLSVLVLPSGSTYSIYIDDKLLEQNTNLKFETELTKGSHRVNVVHPEYGMWEKVVVVVPDTLIAFTFDFASKAKDKFSLTVVSKPVRGVIYVNDINMGSVPKKLSLWEGKHTIEVRKSGYTSDKKLVDLKQDDKLEFILKEIQ